MTKNRKSLTYAQRLLERLRVAHDGASNYRLAQILGITQQTLSIVKTRGTNFSDVTLNKIAQELGEPPMLIIAESHLETQDFPSMNNVWEEMRAWALRQKAKELQALIGDPLEDIPDLKAG